MKTIDPMTASREDLLDALRGIVRPSLYEEAVFSPTAVLRGVYVTITAPDHERVEPFRAPQPSRTLFGFPIVEDCVMPENTVVMRVPPTYGKKHFVSVAPISERVHYARTPFFIRFFRR